MRTKLVGALPYGIQKRVELGRALAMDPKVLLLDEPVAGMNVEETEDIARFVLDIKEELGITIILVEHDMDVVMDIADTITVLNFGSKIAGGKPEDIRSNPKVIEAYLGNRANILREIPWKEDTLPKLFLRNRNLYPDKIALREKDLGVWQPVTWKKYWDHVCFFALGLKTLGLERGGKVAILGR